MDVLGAGDESGGDSDAAGGLDFITCEHPDFNTGVAEEFERGFDIFLEFVFDAGDPEEFEMVFQVLFDNACHIRVSLVQRHRGLLVPG